MIKFVYLAVFILFCCTGQPPTAVSTAARQAPAVDSMDADGCRVLWDTGMGTYIALCADKRPGAP